MVLLNLKCVNCSFALCLIVQRQRCCPENPWSMQSPELVSALKKHAPFKRILWRAIWRSRLQVLENPWFLRLQISISHSQRDKIVTMVMAFRSRLDFLRSVGHNAAVVLTVWTSTCTWRLVCHFAEQVLTVRFWCCDSFCSEGDVL